MKDKTLVFPAATSTEWVAESTTVPLFDIRDDLEGVSLVPYMEGFYDNSLQTSLMRDLAVDLEILGEHLVLLGNQV